MSDLATKHVFFFQYGPASLVKHQYSLQYKSLQSSASLLCLQLSVLHMTSRAASRSKARVFENTRNVVTAICVLILRCVLILLYVFSYYYFVGAGNKARFFFSYGPAKSKEHMTIVLLAGLCRKEKRKKIATSIAHEVLRHSKEQRECVLQKKKN